MRKSKPVIYMVGAHSTGKTTLARWVRDQFGLPMISEVARGVLAEMEAQLDTLRSNMDVVNRYQAEVFERQITAEAEQQGPFVSDRAFCNLAYAAHHAAILPTVAKDPRLLEYMETVKQGIVFFIRPHRELLSSDGVRERMDWEEVVRIDGMVKLMLEMFGIPYIPVASLSMQERVRLMESVLNLAGFEPTVERRVTSVARVPRAEAPATRTEAPATRTEAPATRTDVPPSARAEAAPSARAAVSGRSSKPASRAAGAPGNEAPGNGTPPAAGSAR